MNPLYLCYYFAKLIYCLSNIIVFIMEITLFYYSYYRLLILSFENIFNLFYVFKKQSYFVVYIQQFQYLMFLQVWFFPIFLMKHLCGSTSSLMLGSPREGFEALSGALLCLSFLFFSSKIY